MRKEAKHQIFWLVMEIIVRILIGISVLIVLSLYVEKILLIIIAIFLVWWVSNPVKGTLYFIREDNSDKKKK